MTWWRKGCLNSVGLAGAVLLGTGAVMVVRLLTDFPEPVRIVWDRIRNDPKVREELGESLWYNPFWTGSVRDTEANVKLAVYGTGWRSGIGYGTLVRDPATQEWEVYLLRFLNGIYVLK